MPQDELLPIFAQFGLAGLLGFLIGLEREMRDPETVTIGIQDYVLFALLRALSNTFMKLFLVLTLGHRDLFRHLLVAFLVIGAVGIVTMAVYYDLGAALV
jgi:hypothetical protein